MFNFKYVFLKENIYYFTLKRVQYACFIRKSVFVGNFEISARVLKNKLYFSI